MKTSLADILSQRSVWRGGTLASEHGRTVSTGFAALDRELPGGGWPTGALTEILGQREGVGELQLVLPALAALSASGRRIIWLAPPHLPYAPALAAAGIALEHLSVVRAPGRRDGLWAAEQVLRGGGCHALLAWFRDIRYAELRRLAVAAEAGCGAFVALFRPEQTAHEASPACLRIAFEPAPEGLAIHILKRRGAPTAKPLGIKIERPVHALAGASFSTPCTRGSVARPCSV
ncbi:MAG: translesion DNA synthesis-associated protein ImuA [Burkholderiales bacterium]